MSSGAWVFLRMRQIDGRKRLGVIQRTRKFSRRRGRRRNPPVETEGQGRGRWGVACLDWVLTDRNFLERCWFSRRRERNRPAPLRPTRTRPYGADASPRLGLRRRCEKHSVVHPVSRLGGRTGRGPWATPAPWCPADLGPRCRQAAPKPRPPQSQSQWHPAGPRDPAFRVGRGGLGWWLWAEPLCPPLCSPAFHPASLL